MRRAFTPPGPAARRAVAAAVLGTAAGACRRAPEPDAYGNFEATEVVVSAETGGTLRAFRAAEGDRVAAGAELARVDTTALALERERLLAQRGATGARATEADRQADVLRAQLDVAERAYARTRRLAAERAATAQQLDAAEREVRVLAAQIAAARAQRRGAAAEVAGSDARLAQVRDDLANSRVEAPIAGTVLATYVRAGELVQPGQPLLRLAALDTLELRAYVTQPQLARLRLGQAVTVRVDRGSARGDDVERVARPGTLRWVSARAEFTPTPVQTRDERAELVYAVKIRVPNADGALKIGMPADVTFAPAAGAPAAAPATRAEARPPRVASWP
jgi:HlyD family secretion protein